jgi:hypothetical protein
MGTGWEGVDDGGRIFLFVILGLDPRIHAQASDINRLGGLAATRKNDFGGEGLSLDPRIKSEDDERTGRRVRKGRDGG